MVSLVRHRSFEKFTTLFEKNVQQPLHRTFLKQIGLVKQKLFFDKVTENCIVFNKRLTWECASEQVHLATTAEELIDIFKLRSDVYMALRYDEEFPDLIEGLNFDHYDQNAAIIYNTINREITGTCRLIFDSKHKLPIEEKISFDYIRAQYPKIVEVSRLVVKSQKRGLNLEFKNLTYGAYLLLTQNDIDMSLSVIKKDHFKLYSKFGGFEIEKELHGYGHLDNDFVITKWDPSQISTFFRRAFLQ